MWKTLVMTIHTSSLTLRRAWGRWQVHGSASRREPEREEGGGFCHLCQDAELNQVIWVPQTVDNLSSSAKGIETLVKYLFRRVTESFRQEAHKT